MAEDMEQIVKELISSLHSIQKSLLATAWFEKWEGKAISEQSAEGAFTIDEIKAAVFGLACEKHRAQMVFPCHFTKNVVGKS